MTDVFRPLTLKIIDRSFLHQDKLSITDFKVYLGDTYLLDYHTGVIRFNLTRAQDILIRGRYRTNSGFAKLGVYSSNLDNNILLALATTHSIIEVDWSSTISPEIIAKYSLMDSTHLNSLWLDEEYIIAEIWANITHAHNETVE